MGPNNRRKNGYVCRTREVSGNEKFCGEKHSGQHMQAHSQPSSAQNSQVIGQQNSIHQRHQQPMFWIRIKIGLSNACTHGCMSETISSCTKELAYLKSQNGSVSPLF